MSSFESSARFLRDVLLGCKMLKGDDLGVFSLFNLLSSQVGDFHLPWLKRYWKGQNISEVHELVNTTCLHTCRFLCTREVFQGTDLLDVVWYNLFFDAEMQGIYIGGGKKFYSWRNWLYWLLELDFVFSFAVKENCLLWSCTNH